MRTQIASIVNLHREGSTAIPSLISAWRAVQAANDRGIAARLILVLDSPDPATIATAEQWTQRGADVITLDVGDLGAARNAAAEQVDADWLAFLDADDLWGEQWLASAFSEATHAPPSPTVDVWHPAVNVIFGDHHSLLHHIDSTSPDFSWARLRLHNTWTALCMVRRSHLLSLPYPRNDLDGGFGFEDWSWNIEVLRRGGRHRIVPNTCHFIRRSAPSSDSGTLLQQSQNALRTPYRVDDSIAHIDPSRLPGVTSALSELSAVDTDLPATHRRLPVALSSEILDQVRLAATIEPAVAATIGRASATLLPQNMNTHVGAAQRALEELDQLASKSRFATHADLFEQSPLTAALSEEDRVSVVAQCLLDPTLAAIPRGSSPMLDEAFRSFPQLRSVTW